MVWYCNAGASSKGTMPSDAAISRARIILTRLCLSTASARDGSLMVNDVKSSSVDFFSSSSRGAWSGSRAGA